METLQYLGMGLAAAAQPLYLLCAVGGGLLGVIVGALPGLGSAAGCALLLPLTYAMNPTAAIITLSAVYFGNMFGGAISAVLINIPGDSPAVMTALDGYQITRKGYPGKALFISFWTSAMGGMIGAIMFTMMGTTLANVGIAFGPPEMAMLILLAMTSIGWALGESPAKGMAAAFLGMLLASIGQDIVTGTPRMTFGSINLFGGISFIPVVIGMFGFSQVIETLLTIDKNVVVDPPKIRLKDCMLTKEEWKQMTPTSIYSSVLGFFLGLLPGSGATMASSLAYITEQRVCKNKDEMGKGAINGLSACEAANNSASIGSLVPLLALGIPGSATSAILLGGMMMWGLQPGPLFMSQNPEFAWTLIGSMYLGDILIGILCIVLIPVLIKVLKVPMTILMPIIISISIVGAYSTNQNVFDIYVMLASAFVGYFMIKYKYPLAPFVLMFVVGGTFETSVRQSFIISSGNPLIFLTRPLSLGLFILMIALVAIPMLMGQFARASDAD